MNLTVVERHNIDKILISFAKILNIVKTKSTPISDFHYTYFLMELNNDELPDSVKTLDKSLKLRFYREIFNDSEKFNNCVSIYMVDRYNNKVSTNIDKYWTLNDYENINEYFGENDNIVPSWQDDILLALYYKYKRLSLECLNKKYNKIQNHNPFDYKELSDDFLNE